MIADAEMPELADESDAEEIPLADGLAPGQADDEHEEVEPRVRDSENLLAPEVGQRASGSVARLVPQLVVPTEEAQMKHVASCHVPYASWCKYCVVGRAKDDPHKRQVPRTSTLPVIEMDYVFLTEKDQGTLTVAVVNHKGAEKSGVDYFATWLETLGYRQFEVHTDGEPSSSACMRAAVSQHAATFPESEREKIVIRRRESPIDSHASLGSGEGANQIVEGLWRTMRADLDDNLGKKLRPTSAILSWVPQYVTWCYNRNQPTRDDRQTPFERATLKTYDHPVLHFGERILVRTIPEGKAQARWIYGFWIGRSLLANDHLVLTTVWCATGLCDDFLLAKLGETRRKPVFWRCRGHLGSRSPHTDDDVRKELQSVRSSLRITRCTSGALRRTGHQRKAARDASSVRRSLTTARPVFCV